MTETTETAGCYICQPDTPGAADEACRQCEREYWANPVPVPVDVDLDTTVLDAYMTAASEALQEAYADSAVGGLGYEQGMRIMLAAVLPLHSRDVLARTDDELARWHALFGTDPTEAARRRERQAADDNARAATVARLRGTIDAVRAIALHGDMPETARAELLALLEDCADA